MRAFSYGGGMVDALTMEAQGFGRSVEACPVCQAAGLWVDAAGGWEACDRCMEVRRHGAYSAWPRADLESLYALRFGLAHER